MVTHDFHCPIPPSTVRVSVILGGDSFTVDLPSAKLGATLQAFEDHSGPLSSDRCAEVTTTRARLRRRRCGSSCSSPASSASLTPSDWRR
jgi:hypothetical protein